MASSVLVYSSNFTSKEGILHISFGDKWKKKWLILNGSSLIVYKNKSKERIPKLVFDLTKAIAISCPLVVEPECPSLPPKIPVIRGFAIRFNQFSDHRIFSAFAYSHFECLQWVQCLRINTNSSQQMSLSTAIQYDQPFQTSSYGNEPDIPSAQVSRNSKLSLGNEPVHYPSFTIQKKDAEDPIYFQDYCMMRNKDLESIEGNKKEKPIRQSIVRSSSLIELSPQRVETEILMEKFSQQAVFPVPPPYNPNYNN